jgi:hypothetical protein
VGHRYFEIAFTDAVKALQEQAGSRANYARRERPDAPAHDHLTEAAAGFISGSDSFFLASVSATGWPYMQHRGGRAGFVKVLDARTIAFADFAGNRQYISVGNLATDDRVALFFMDYPSQTRLKLLGHARVIGADDPRLAQLVDPDYPARVERGIVITVAGFDWNCSQHITQRFTLEQVQQATVALRQRIAYLEAELAAAQPS